MPIETLVYTWIFSPPVPRSGSETALELVDLVARYSKCIHKGRNKRVLLLQYAPKPAMALWYLHEVAAATEFVMYACAELNSLRAWCVVRLNRVTGS
jgi:hypothetical protein